MAYFNFTIFLCFSFSSYHLQIENVKQNECLRLSQEYRAIVWYLNYCWSKCLELLVRSSANIPDSICLILSNQPSYWLCFKPGDREVMLKKCVKESVQWARLEDSKVTTVREFISGIHDNSQECNNMYLFDWSLPLHCPKLAEEITIPKYFAGIHFWKVLDSKPLYDVYIFIEVDYYLNFTSIMFWFYLVVDKNVCFSSD